MTLADKARQAGVVGAGGGGFPAHVKLSGKADIVIANGAECEPLLHKDAAVMENFAAELVRGLQLSMDAVEAKEGVIGVKAKNTAAVEAVRAAAHATPIRVELLGDYYPAGDEYDLVYSVTGKLIPPGGIPLNVGVVVNNVETLVNIAAAHDGTPVTLKTLTLAGAVHKPVTVVAPLGMSLRECIETAAGGFATHDPVYCIGGLMMGDTTDDLEQPVTKTTTGVVVLPRTHHVVERKLKPPTTQAKIGKSACDQCRYCTEYCPRYLLGYAVEPHQVMRSLSFTATGADYWNQFAALCCSCGLCTLFACPEELYPKEACDDSRTAMREAGIKWSGPTEVKVHPIRDGRRVPIKTLVRRLDITEYDHHTPFYPTPLQPRKVCLPLRQGAGVAGQSLVHEGDRVTAGQVLSAIPSKDLGSVVHAPFDAVVSQFTNSQLILTRLS